MYMEINDFIKQCPSLLSELTSLRNNTYSLLAPELIHSLLETKSEDSRKQRKNLNSDAKKQ